MLKIVPFVRSVITQDGAIILDVKNDTILTLNHTGGYIWERLQQGKLLDAIISELSRDTLTDAAVVERDVHNFVEKLKLKHLLT